MKRHGERIFREKKRYGERKNIDILKRDTYMVHGLERWTSLTCGTVCTPTTKFRLHFTAYALWTLSSHTNVNFTRLICCSWRLCLGQSGWQLKPLLFNFHQLKKWSYSTFQIWYFIIGLENLNQICGHNLFSCEHPSLHYTHTRNMHASCLFRN